MPGKADKLICVCNADHSDYILEIYVIKNNHDYLTQENR